MKDADNLDRIQCHVCSQKIVQFGTIRRRIILLEQIKPKTVNQLRADDDGFLIDQSTVEKTQYYGKYGSF